jgi:hypothetical protein
MFASVDMYMRGSISECSEGDSNYSLARMRPFLRLQSIEHSWMDKTHPVWSLSIVVRIQPANLCRFRMTTIAKVINSGEPDEYTSESKGGCHIQVL